MMRVFIKNAVYFLLPVLIVSIGADFLISTSLKKSKTYASGEYPTWNDLYRGKIDSEIVIYGSSRAWVQINPSMMEDSLKRSCYNLGIDGHNIWAQYFRHQQYLKYNPKPKTIIHSLDISTLGERGDLFNAEQLLPYMLFDKSIETFTKDYNGYSYLDFRLPLLRYAGNNIAILHALKLLFTDQPSNIGRQKGYEGQDTKWNDDFIKAKAKMDFYEATIDSAAVHLFEHYLQECHEQNIQIIFVYTPQYIEGQRFVKNKDAILDMYRNISTEYQIPFLDYTEDSISYDRENFYNTGHLNKSGAETFTRKLIHDLKSRTPILEAEN